MKMNYECKAETGVQLLARIGSRPNLKGFDNGLFFTDEVSFPIGGDILEISGDHSTGKTLLITHIIAQCLLPSKMQLSPESDEFNLGGLEAAAILIVTDFHFQIAKLAQIMEYRLRNCFCMHSSNPIDSRTADTIERVMKNSLSKLITLNCYDSSQLLATFYSLERYLSADQSITMVILDSASAYYWQDVSISTSNKSMDSYLRSIVSSLNKCVREFKTLIIYTRPKYFHSKNPVPSKSAGGHSSGIPNFKIELSRAEDEQVINPIEEQKISIPFKALIHTPTSSYTSSYYITQDGIISKQSC